jgi:hypothetical protein
MKCRPDSLQSLARRGFRLFPPYQAAYFFINPPHGQYLELAIYCAALLSACQLLQGGARPAASGGLLCPVSSSGGLRRAPSAQAQHLPHPCRQPGSAIPASRCPPCR